MPLPDASLPDDSVALKAIIAELQRQGAELRQSQAAMQQKHDAMYVELLRLQVELLRLKKQYYGPRADRGVRSAKRRSGGGGRVA